MHVPSLLLTLALCVIATPALAAPEAHMLRLDPRSAVEDNAPVLTTVIELVQHKSMADLTAQCARLKEDKSIQCLAEKLDRRQALYAPFKFPKDHAHLLVEVDGADRPAKMLTVQKWGANKHKKGVGTAWLLLIDASGSFGATRLADAKSIAKAFIARMGPHDIVNVMFFNHRSVVNHLKWTAAKSQATRFVDSVASPYPQPDRTKTMGSIVRKAVTDAFGELGNVGGGVDVPLHQAMVVMSDANAGTDMSSNSAGALQLNNYLTRGRFPADNTSLPRMPLPVISIWFPNKEVSKTQSHREEVFENARQFMENLANPKIGGSYHIVPKGYGSKGPTIAKNVIERFDLMNIVRWRVSCLDPKVTQNFRLVFDEKLEPAITPDECRDCPLGQDPKLWPLDINYERTLAWAKKNPLQPGGKVKVFGRFCWGTKVQRAELYLLPQNQPAPDTLEGKTLEEAEKARNDLIGANLRGKPLTGSDAFIEFELPDNAKWLKGKKKAKNARFVVVDARAGRTSPITDDKIITVRAANKPQKPKSYLMVGAVTFAGVVIFLLLLNLFIGSGRSRRRPVMIPRPVVATPGVPRPAPAPVAPPPMAVDHRSGIGAPPAVATHATIQGSPGMYPIRGGAELKVGRDSSLCDISLTEPRISGTHATLKFAGGQLFVRDEGSNNGTFINAARIASYCWTSVPRGGSLRFGPVEFAVRLD